MLIPAGHPDRTGATPQEAEHTMDWSDRWRGAFRFELRAEAIGLAQRGWPVFPGTFPDGDQWIGRAGQETAGPVPVHHDWARRVGQGPDQVADWWSGQPYTLLVATGIVLDAIAVRAPLGRATASALRAVGVPVPIVATPDGQWMFLTRPGRPEPAGPAEFGGLTEVTHHGVGRFIPLPPSPYQYGVVHWRARPQPGGRHLPDPEIVAAALREAARITAARPGDLISDPAPPPALVNASR